MQAIVVGSTVRLTNGEAGKITEILEPKKGPAWERNVAGRDVFLDQELTLDNVEKWGANLVVEVDGRRRYVTWLDINAATLQAPTVELQAAPAARAPKLQMPVQGKVPIGLLPVRPKLTLKPIKPN